MKIFVVSDIHGFYNEMMEALHNAGFDENNNEHFIISCGDACDRGPDSVKVLEFFLDLYEKGRAILVLGNHEDLMNEAIRRSYFKSHDIHNKTTLTASQLTGIEDYDEALMAMKDNELWKKYMESCVNYYELQDYIFVHGWIPVSYEYDKGYEDLPELYQPSHEIYNPEWRDTVWGDEWEQARWLNGMKMWKCDIKEPNKTIICGHFHTSWGHSYLHDDGQEWVDEIGTCWLDSKTGRIEPHANFDIFYDDGIIALDACTAYTHKVNVLVLDNMEIK